MDAAMDALVARAPSALGVDGAALVGLWIKGQRERAAVRLQAVWREWRARFTPAGWCLRRFRIE